MSEKLFLEYYKKLNFRQKEAVDWVEGPIMVVAGPGTGKTQILTLRIANILRKTQIEPENILALTFTEYATSSMRRRLGEIIGSAAYRVNINTFHGFCNDTIKTNPDGFPRIIGSENITEAEQIKIVQQCIERLPLRELKPFGDPLYYLRSSLAAINQLKREGLDPEYFKNIVARERKDFDDIDDLCHEKGPHKGKIKSDYQKLFRQIEKNKELATLYAAYQEKLQQQKVYDYNDMIMDVLKKIADDPDFLLSLQEKYQYVLVDEHQDTNNAQNKILELLCNFHTNPNIFIVGDEKQSIFRFQGASLQNFNHFKQLYPNAHLVTLEENYRSNQTILDSAHSLITAPVVLKAKAAHQPNPIRLHEFSLPEYEKNFLAEDVKNKINSGVAPGEIAVLYRDNKDALSIASALVRAGIPCAIESEQHVFGDNDIRKLIILFQAIANFSNPERIIALLHLNFWDIPPLDVYRLAQYVSYNKALIHDVLARSDILDSLHLESKEKLISFKDTISRLLTSSKNDNLPVFFEHAVHDSGFLKSLVASPDAVEKIEKLNTLFGEVKNFSQHHEDSTLEEFLSHVELLREHNILNKKASVHQENKVRLMTAHKSKGLEFDYVYITDAYDGHWGNRRKFEALSVLPAALSLHGGALLSSNDKNDDERRLFYVALTRARKEVAVFYATVGESGREQLPSQFIQEIRSEYMERVDIKNFEPQMKHNPVYLTTIPSRLVSDAKDKDFVRSIFLSRGLSVTALNNYLNCPWNYFYNNLLRIPRAKTKHQMYGTAIHGALKDFFEKRKTGQAYKQLLLERFERYTSKEDFSPADLLGIVEKGTKALNGYYDTYNNSWHTDVRTEFSISEVILSPEIHLTGTIDKMECFNNNEVVVVDYKTSKPKSRGEIEGTTRSAHGNGGDIKRQLVFYNLLLNKFKNGQYLMTAGEIDFIEPDDHGKYHRENFVVDKHEVDELEQTIHTVSHEILNLDFWDKRCGQKDCEYCTLREVMV